MNTDDLSNRASNWKNATNLAATPLIGIYPPCSDASQSTDDGDISGRAVWFMVMQSCGSEMARVVCEAVARLYRHEKNLVVLIRENASIGPDVAHYFAKAWELISAPHGKPGDVLFLSPDDRSWKRIFESRQFEGEADPMGKRPIRAIRGMQR